MAEEYFDVYKFESEYVKHGRTLLPTGMGILYKKDIVMRIGDTYIDKNKNMYIIDMNDNKKIYKQSIKALIIWLSFLCILSTLSYYKLQRIINVENNLMIVFTIVLFTCSLLLFLISIISFLCGVNCYGIEIYEGHIRKRTNQCINIMIYVFCLSMIMLML